MCNDFLSPGLKGCQGNVFTYSVQISGQVGRRWKKVCLVCISETVRCMQLILSREIG